MVTVNISLKLLLVRGSGRLDVNCMHVKEIQTVYKHKIIHLRGVAGNSANKVRNADKAQARTTPV